MAAVVKSMAVVQYYRDGRPWTCDVVPDPKWPDVFAAVEAMDNFYFPIVLLSLQECERHEEVFADEDAFNIIGGNGRYALFQMIAGWQFTDPEGSEAETRLWESDQGYFCEERNVVAKEKAMRIIRAYFETGSYDGLDSIQ